MQILCLFIFLQNLLTQVQINFVGQATEKGVSFRPMRNAENFWVIALTLEGSEISLNFQDYIIKLAVQIII